MRQQTIIALGIALVLGLVAVYLANIFLTQSEQRAAAAETTKIAVAAIPLDYGAELTPDKVRFIDYPVQSLPPGSYRSLAQLLPQGKTRAVLRPMTINEPILASKLTGEGQGASIAQLLPDGKRAVSVRIDDVSGVAGFIQPNDAVDVLVTRQVAAGTNNRVQVTDVLLQNTKVLAMGQDAKNADGQPKIARSATLEVDPLDAQKLALAQEVGSLSLVLRRPGEEQNSPVVSTVSLDDLRYGRAGARPYTTTPLAAQTAARPRATVARAPRRAVRRPVIAAPARPVTSNVQVVRGTEGSNYEVGRYDS